MSMTFTDWMREANRECNALAGVDLLDLPDVGFRDMYLDEMSPRSAAVAAIREAGGEDLLTEEDE